MKIILLSIFIFLLGLSSTALSAFTSEQPLSDPKLEARAKALFAEIRCVVCVSQSLADSDVTLARDLRKIIREKIEAGDTDTAIKAYLVGRYGEQVLMEPAVNEQTVWLWLIPLLLLCAGSGVIFAITRKKT